jgi:hypothetical protein
MSVYLFFSYAAEDRTYVEELAPRLKQEAGLDAWWFEANQRAGRDYRKEIRRHIAGAHAVIVIISRASADSVGVLKEISFAKRIGKRPIPIVIGPATSGSPFTGIPEGDVIYEIRHLDCINGREGHDPLPRLLDALTPGILSQNEQQVQADPTAPPDHLQGQNLKGYLLGRRVSVTNTSMLYRALEPLVAREVAIKVVRHEYANQPDYIRRFDEEARRIARLDPIPFK